MKRIFIMTTLILTLGTFSHARDFSKTVIVTKPVAGSVHMITGEGGNIAVSIGEDGVMMVDDQFAELNERIMNAVKDLSEGSVEFVLNTHWHGDHTGGNELMQAAGAHIIAHENVRKRLSTRQVRELVGRTTEASPKAALPVLTFDEAVTLHFNNETIDVMHFGPGHTDGDSVVFFKNANTVHMGDLFFSGRFPFIDLDSGGSVDGYFKNVNLILNMIDDKTQIIPGHGPLSTQADLIMFRDMIEASIEIVQAAKTQGRPLDELIKMDPLADYTDWGTGFINTERWLTTLYTYYK